MRDGKGEGRKMSASGLVDRPAVERLSERLVDGRVRDGGKRRRDRSIFRGDAYSLPPEPTHA